jgi:WhiB family redox-sensing transcriptional regulator
MTRLTYRVHGTDRGDDWRDQGLCRQADPEEFFAKSTPAIQRAKRICRACPVRPQCVQFAVTNGERFGVWGGLSQTELRPLRNRHRQQKQATA